MLSLKKNQSTKNISFFIRESFYQPSYFFLSLLIAVLFHIGLQVIFKIEEMNQNIEQILPSVIAYAQPIHNTIKQTTFTDPAIEPQYNIYEYLFPEECMKISSLKILKEKDLPLKDMIGSKQYESAIKNRFIE